MDLIHGSCVAISGKGVVLRGPSGSGKSDLALRLIDDGASLISDDQITISVRDKRVFASAPPAIAGMLEARGIGIVQLEYLDETQVHLIIDLVPTEPVERMPVESSTTLEGISLPLTRLASFESSNPAKVRLALHAATGDLNIQR